MRIVASFLPDGCDGQPAVRIEVIDTGIGIREEVLPQLFQPFHQGDAAISRKFGGTGLGLAISHHIAHLLGGDLTATSVWGQGSTFTLTVPTGSLKDIRMLQRPTEVEHETAGHVWQPTAEDLRGVRVLLAEDGFDNRELIRTILQRAGAEVETAENGRLAVAKAESGPFDLILMDINMPEMDGYEATRLLRDRGYRRTDRGADGQRHVRRQRPMPAAGCNEYLTKPIDRARLIRTIAAHVDTKAAAERPPPSGERTGSGANSEAIVSQFIDDPDMAQIIQGFVGRLADQLDAMRQALAGGRHEELRRLAHQLKGAGGSYGYPSLTEACKVLEDSAKMRDNVAAGAALDRRGRADSRH